MPTLEWNVKNAISRDVERQHLNKILADIRASVNMLSSTTGTANSANSIKDIVGEMVSENAESGISVSYNNMAKVLDFAVSSFVLTLTGDVSGTAVLTPGGAATMSVTIDPSKVGISDAPSNSFAYWRRAGTWEAVGNNVEQLQDFVGPGIIATSYDVGTELTTLHARTIQTGPGIVWTNGDGAAGDPTAEFDADTGEVASLSGATYKTVQKVIDVMFSPGIIDGGDITELTTTSVRINAGTAVIRIADDNVSELRFFDFPSQDFNISDVQVTHYYRLEYNGGSPIITDNPLDDADLDTEIPMGAASRADGFLNIIPNPYRVGDVVTNLIQRLDAVSPVQRDASVGGLELGNTATRTTTLTAGRLWSRVSDFLIPAKNSSVDTMSSAYYNGGTPALTVVSGLTQWDNLNYNDTGSGTLVALGNNKYANLWFFMSFNGDHYGWVYGTGEHNTVGDAANEGVPFFLPQNFFRQYILLGRYIFEKGVDTPILIESAFETLFTTQAVNDHNLLAGLQGGTIGEYYHLTAAEHTKVQALPASSQPLDADLTALATLGSTGFAARTAADTWAQRSFPDGTGFTWTNPAGIAGNPTLVLNANLQAWSGLSTSSKQDTDETLTALAGQNWAANSMPLGTGVDTVTQLSLAANTFPGRSSAGNVVAKTITDGSFTALAGAGGTAAFLRSDGQNTNRLIGPFSSQTGNPGTGLTASAYELFTDNSAGTAAIRAYRGSTSSSTGIVFAPANSGTQADALWVAPDGKVGIGALASTFMFEVTGSTAGVAITRTGGNEPFIQLTDNLAGTNGGQVRGLVTGAGIRFTNRASTTEFWRINPHFLPATDNSTDVGSGSLRVREYFGANGTINTSDAREKTVPRDLYHSELAAAHELARLPCIFQWLNMIAEKGENVARLHCGPTVQAVISVMESHGLDPFRYGFVCYDEWEELPEIVGGDGEVVQASREAGDLYSLRPSELAWFVIRGQAKRQDDLEARISALEIG